MHQKMMVSEAAVAFHRRSGGWRHRLLHLAGAALLLLSLTGCLLDGFTLPPAYRPAHPGATEPVANGSAWKLAPTSDRPAAVYLRVFRVAANVYAMEKFLDLGNGEPAKIVVTVARFIPLGNAWYALHWQDKDGLAQGYHLVRLTQEAGSPSLWLLEPSVQPEKIIQAARSVGRLRVEKNTFQLGLKIDATNEPQVLQFLKTLTGTPSLAASTLSSVDGIPAELTRQAYDAAGNSFSHIDHRDFSDRERGAYVAGYFQALHAQGNGWGSYGLARLMQQGWSVPQDLQKARELSQLAIQRGVPQAANLLGIQAYYGVAEAANPSRALKYFQQAADAGEPRAYLMLGIAHMEGKGVPRDDKKARFWLEKAEAHVPLAKTRLAEVLLREKRPESDKRAVELLEGAIAGGDFHAHELRGWMHEHGRGGAADQVAATKAYLAGAQAGDAQAQWKVGERLFRGVGSAVDRASGQKWLQAAAQAGIAEAGEALKKFQAKDPATSEDDWRDRALRVTEQHMLTLAKSKRANIAGLRVKLKNSAEFKVLTLSRKLREEILSGRESGDLVPGKFQTELSEAHDDIVKIEAMGRNYFSLRLPDGRIASLRPDGRYVALARDSDVEFDARVLPRPGDQLLERSAEPVLVEYEQAWSDVPIESNRITANIMEINRAIGNYQCESRISAGAVRWRNEKNGVPLVVDVGRTLRYREQWSSDSGRQWSDVDWYAPLDKLSHVEYGNSSSGCGYVRMYCLQRRPCAVRSAGEGKKIETSSSLFIKFSNSERAGHAAGLLQWLIN